MTPEDVHRNLCALRAMIANAQETDRSRRRWAELLLGEATADAMVEALHEAIIDQECRLGVYVPTPEPPRGYTFPFQSPTERGKRPGGTPVTDTDSEKQKPVPPRSSGKDDSSSTFPGPGRRAVRGKENGNGK
jgi:hypothetical protein